MTLCATFIYTLDIALACSITHHIYIFVNYLSVLMFPLSGKLLQTVKLLTCVRETSSSWTTAFQPKDNKLHRECNSYDRLWCVQYWVSQMVSFPQVSPPKPCICLASPPIHATCPVHLILLHFIIQTILGEEYRSLSSSLCSFLHSPDTSSLLGQNILLNTKFSNTFLLCSPLKVSNQVSYPYKQKSKL